MDKQSGFLSPAIAGWSGRRFARRLSAAGFANLILRTRGELDLRSGGSEPFFRRGAARVRVSGGGEGRRNPREQHVSGGIPRATIWLIQTNVIDAAYRHGARSCCFWDRPAFIRNSRRSRFAKSALLTGALEPTNEWYAIAKIAGIKMAQAYRQQYGFRAISLMPTNLYGPGDNFDLKSSHVLPALMRKFHEAIARVVRSDHLGHGQPAARIPARGRSGRRRCFSDAAL